MLKSKNIELKLKIKQLEDQSATFDLTKSELINSNLASSNILNNLDETARNGTKLAKLSQANDNSLELEKKITRLTADNEKLAKELEMAVNSKTTTVQAFKSKIEGLNDKIYDLKNEQRQNAQSNQTRDSQLDISQLADRDLSEELFRLETENKELRRLQKKRQLEFQQRIEKLQNQVHEFESKQEDWQYVTSGEPNKRVEKMRDRLKVKITQIGELNTEVTDIKLENAKLKMEVSKLEELINKKYKVVADLLQEADLDMSSASANNKEKYSKAVSYIVQKNNILAENYRILQKQMEQSNTNPGAGTGQASGADPGLSSKVEELEKENKMMIEENSKLQMKLMEQMQLINDLNSREFLYRKLMRKHKIKPP